MRCISLSNFLRARTFGYKIAFVDPGIATQHAIDDNERAVEDYIINVLEKSKDQELILWPFHQPGHWILISISLWDGNVHYLNSSSHRKKKFLRM